MKPKDPLVSIVVVNYNGSQFLKECFDSLFKLEYPAGGIEILMVDNCSEDDSIGLVKNNFPKVKILKNDVNNYTRANNLGIKHAQGDFVAFINNDVQVDRAWLVELMEVMKKEKRAGIVGGKILLEDGKLQSAALEEYPNFYWGDRGLRQEDRGQYEHLEEVQGLCGAAVLFRKSCLEEIGLFDEDFMMYLEDVDMCLRCAKKKWKVFYAPKSTAKHRFRGTSSDESVRYYSERNRLLLIARHFPAQLGGALFGQGYFTGSDNSIFDIFPLIFRKLLESQSAQELEANLPVIFTNLKNISALEKNILMDRIREFKITGMQNETALSELRRTNSALQADLQKAAREIELKDALLREKEDSLARLNRANGQFNEQLKKAIQDIQSQGDQLRKKEAQLDQSEIQLHKLKEELMISKADLEKTFRFDRKIKILFVKPSRITIEDTLDAVRIIKDKYPHSSVYLFAHLPETEYEKLIRDKNVETGLIYGWGQAKSMIRTAKLFTKLFLFRFDLAVTLASHQAAQGLAGHKFARLITILSNSRNQCVYYVD